MPVYNQYFNRLCDRASIYWCYKPIYVTTEQLGLPRCQRIGHHNGYPVYAWITAVVYKFFPFYKGSPLPSKKRVLPFITITVLLFRVYLCVLPAMHQGSAFIQKFSERSPLFVQYSCWYIPFCLFYLLFIVVRRFDGRLKKEQPPDLCGLNWFPG